MQARALYPEALGEVTDEGGLLVESQARPSNRGDVGNDTAPESCEAAWRDEGRHRTHRCEQECPGRPREHSRGPVFERVQLGPQADDTYDLSGDHSGRRLLEAVDARLHEAKELPSGVHRPHTVGPYALPCALHLATASPFSR